ncbi:hypothetical protein [Mycoplasma sp. 21DD0573]|nr:hypothetical protein [Mycoplasma sp. 21DD0573]MEA4276635.1 hypothetical protein [Mycoplasma sp. 21DD0573]
MKNAKLILSIFTIGSLKQKMQENNQDCLNVKINYRLATKLII